MVRVTNLNITSPSIQIQVHISNLTEISEFVLKIIFRGFFVNSGDY